MQSLLLQTGTCLFFIWRSYQELNPFCASCNHFMHWLYVSSSVESSHCPVELSTVTMLSTRHTRYTNNSKRLPVLLHGPEACSLQIQARLTSHLIAFFTKLFRTNNIETVKVFQSFFGISLPSVVLRNKTDKFECRDGETDRHLVFVWN